MAKQIKAKLPVAAWNWLFQKLAQFELPEKVGETSYDPVQRRIVKDECSSATRELRAYSPWAQALGNEMRLVFGPKDCWNSDPDGKPGDLKCTFPEKECEVLLSEDAASGISWMLLTMLCPATVDEKTGRVSHEEIPPFLAAMYAWPIAAAIRREKVLRSALHLDSSDKKRKWADDPEPETQPVKD